MEHDSLQQPSPFEAVPSIASDSSASPEFIEEPYDERSYDSGYKSGREDGEVEERERILRLVEKFDPADSFDRSYYWGELLKAIKGAK